MSVSKRVLGSEFKKCDNCSYERGFHSSFLKEGDAYIVVLVCPECGAKYNVGWKVELC